jgi:hypothetical protein
MSSKAATSKSPQNTRTQEQISERKSRMIGAFDQAFDKGVKELDKLAKPRKRK